MVLLTDQFKRIFFEQIFQNHANKCFNIAISKQKQNKSILIDINIRSDIF